MRIVRVLMYEGPEDRVRAQLEKSFLYEGKVLKFGLGEGTVREVFRGQLSEPGKVFFLDEADEQAKECGHVFKHDNCPDCNGRDVLAEAEDATEIEDEGWA